jgi:hypothetical protein
VVRLAIGSLLGALVGCGAGEYNRLLNVRNEKARTAAKFNELYAPQALEDTAVSVRIPQVFVSPPMAEGRGAAVDPRRLKPGLVTLPFLKLTYEATIKDEKGGTLPYYCYVGATKGNGSQLPEVEKTLRAELAGKSPTVLSDWTDFQGETPDGKEVKWEKLRCVAPQEFACNDASGKTHFETLPGVLEIYLYEDSGHLVFFAWRLPKSVESDEDLPSKVHLTKWALLMAGCVSIKP